MAEFLDDLDRLCRRAEALETWFGTARTKAPPGAQGTDRTGAVRVVVDADGLPATVDVSADWPDVLAATAFGGAVLEGAEAAGRARLSAWSHAIADEARPDPGHGILPCGRPLAGRPDGGGVLDRPVPHPTGAVRSLRGLVDEVLRPAVAGVGEGSRSPVTGTGSDSSGEIVVVLSETGLVSCTAGPRWLSYQPGDALTAALGQALIRARGALSQAVSAARTDGDRDPLFEAVAAFLAAAARSDQFVGRDIR